MWIELIAIGWLTGRYIYHKLHDKEETDHARFRIPASDDGGVIPLIYGRCRVRNPVQAWISKPAYAHNGLGVGAVYQCNIFYVLGIGMDDGNGTNRVHTLWMGDLKFPDGVDAGGTYSLETRTGDGGFEASANVVKTTEDGYYLGGLVEFLNGRPGQMLVDDVPNSVTYTGTFMLDDLVSPHLTPGRRLTYDQIPGYRGYLSVMLHDFLGGLQWRIGPDGTVPGYSFECSSYQTGNGYPGVGVYGMVGPDSNPINVIYDLLKCYFGKLGLSATTYIDNDSFGSAAIKLYNESHGYSRAMEESKTADEWILEILKQIDGTLYEDPETGKIGIKLIRNDYDVSTIPIINKSNCHALESFAAGSWASIPNKIKIVFTNRDDDYRDGTATAQSMANAVGQDNIVREEIIRMPGCTHSALAQRLAARELAARSVPITKCRVIVDRSLLYLKQGDAVKLVWNDPDIGGMVMRVASVNHGVLNDGKIAIDLIQDYFYTFRGSFPGGGKLGDLGGPNFENIMRGF